MRPEKFLVDLEYTGNQVQVRKVLSLGYENPLKVLREFYFTVHVN